MIMKLRKVDSMEVKIYDTRGEMGKEAGKAASDKIKRVIAEKGEARVIFAAAPSQNEVLAALVADIEIDWQKVIGFHMDEYLGISEDAPQRFSQFLKRSIFEKVNFKEVHLLTGKEEDCDTYEKLLKEKPIDLVCLGIGENGHLAFNDPPVANFKDSNWVKVVKLDEICRTQQVNDGCFVSLDQVPTHAITLTIPALMSGKAMICTVPGSTKAKAIQCTLEGPISESCPASILRTHESCILYVDREAYQNVKN